MSKGLDIRENVVLATMTTLGVGGAARFFAEIKTEEELAEVLEFAESKGLRVFVLGGGSNVLISDEGFDGVVIRVVMAGISLMELPLETGSSSVLVTARAGEDWDEFVEWCVENDLAGLECLSGIPGSVGGTPIQNVGAYGQEVSETIVSVRVMRRSDREVLDISGADCGFSYRSSIFNTTEKNKYIVLSVTFELVRGGDPKIAYADLEKELDGNASLSDVRGAVRRVREAKGMLVRQGGADSRSAGSFFKNPVVSAERFEELVTRIWESGLVEEGEHMPSYASPGGEVKIPAAWLIEKAGFGKGYIKGNAGISNVHALALTNRGGATAAEIVALKHEIQAKVLEAFGVDLVPEPTFVGFGGDSTVGAEPV